MQVVVVEFAGGWRRDECRESPGLLPAGGLPELTIGPPCAPRSPSPALARPPCTPPRPRPRPRPPPRPSVDAARPRPRPRPPPPPRPGGGVRYAITVKNQRAIEEENEKEEGRRRARFVEMADENERLLMIVLWRKFPESF